MVFIYSILLTIQKKKKAENYFLWVVGISGWKALAEACSFLLKAF